MGDAGIMQPTSQKKKKKNHHNINKDQTTVLEFIGIKENILPEEQLATALVVSCVLIHDLAIPQKQSAAQ